MSFTNFRDAAYSVVEKFVKKREIKPIEKVYGMPEYCGAETYRVPGMDGMSWIVLYRQGAVDLEDDWQKTLKVGLERLVREG